MEFELEGRTYRVGKIDARAQFHIVRRLAPVLGELAGALQGRITAPAVESDDEAKKAKTAKAAVEALPPIANAISRLSDSEADYVIFGLLKVVVRKQDQGLGWGPVTTGEQLMYDDINMTTMLKLAWKALSFNMSGFFNALPSDLKEAALKVTGQ